MPKQSAEAGTLFTVRARDTIVRIYTDGIPLRVGFNQLVKVPFLRFIGVFLVR